MFIANRLGLASKPRVRSMRSRSSMNTMRSCSVSRLLQTSTSGFRRTAANLLPASAESFRSNWMASRGVRCHPFLTGRVHTLAVAVTCPSRMGDVQNILALRASRLARSTAVTAPGIASCACSVLFVMVGGALTATGSRSLCGCFVKRQWACLQRRESSRSFASRIRAGSVISMRITRYRSRIVRILRKISTTTARAATHAMQRRQTAKITGSVIVENARENARISRLLVGLTGFNVSREAACL